MTTTTFGPGITLGSGITVGTLLGFTINPSDFTDAGSSQGTTPDGTNGFTMASSPNYNNIVNYLYHMFNPTGDIGTRISNVFTSAGMNPADAYAFNVTWGAGSSITSGIIRLSWTGTYLTMCPIDTTDTQWQSGSVSGPALYGTFNFPATFTPYNPITQLSTSGDWC